VRLASLIRRAIAISIDGLIFIFAILIPIASTHGSLPGSGFYVGFRINEHLYYLGNLPLLVATGSWFAYMIVCEATVGASLGKFVMRIRVRAESRSGVGFAAATVRNLLRLVDVLPILYLLGGIVAWRSPKSQRIGDHVAKTVVLRRGAEGATWVVPIPPPPATVATSAPAGAPPATPPPPTSPRVPRRLGLVAGLVVVALIVVAYTEIGRPPAGVYRSHGITFDYPTSWRRLPVTYQVGTPPLFHDAVGIDAPDSVGTSGYELKTPVDQSNLPAVQAQLGLLVPGMVQGLQGTLESGLSPTVIGGLPALTMTVQYPSRVGDVVTERDIFVFSGSLEYEINCAWTAAHEQDLQAGCAQVLSTLRIG